MKILVCGGREYGVGPMGSFGPIFTAATQKAARQRDYLRNVLTALRDEFKGQTITIISGGASGADNLAAEWARKNDKTSEVYPADWKQYGKSAGPRRNQQMIDEGKPELVIAFTAGKMREDSPGTFDMMDRAKKAGIRIRQYTDI